MRLRPSGPISTASQALLLFNGTNGSTTMTDVSGKTWTAKGGAKLSTAQSIEGGSSLLVNGTTDWIQTPFSTDFQVGTGDFTVECWIYRVGGASGTLFSLYTGGSGGNGGISFGLDGSNRLQCARSGVSVALTAATAIAAGAWRHVALCRSGSGGNNTKLFLDGVLDAQTTDTATFSDSGTGASASLGAYLSNSTTGAGFFNGYIDDFRFKKGVALYPSAFTPPTPPLT
jgi:hypothetical protein